jgi:hypothetical protein
MTDEVSADERNADLYRQAHQLAAELADMQRRHEAEQAPLLAAFYDVCGQYDQLRAGTASVSLPPEPPNQEPSQPTRRFA